MHWVVTEACGCPHLLLQCARTALLPFCLPKSVSSSESLCLLALCEPAASSTLSRTSHELRLHPACRVLLGPEGTGDMMGMTPSATGEVPATAARLSYSLKGRIAWEALNQLSHLVALDLDANLLSGSLPNYLPSALEGLSVNWNRLTGSLPPMLSPPTSLKSLSVAVSQTNVACLFARAPLHDLLCNAAECHAGMDWRARLQHCPAFMCSSTS